MPSPSWLYEYLAQALKRPQIIAKKKGLLLAVPSKDSLNVSKNYSIIND
jgi:hypothetical protein